MKKCVDCNIEKDKINFWKRKQNSDGLSKFCKDCGKIKNKNYCEKNKEQIKEKNIAYREANRDKINIKNKELYKIQKKDRLEYARIKRDKTKKDVEENGLNLPNIKEKKCTHCNLIKTIDMFYIRKTKNNYTEMCKECKKKESSEYRKQNREKINIYLKKYLKTDSGVLQRIGISLRNRLSSAIKTIDTGKTKLKNDLIGCSKEFLKKWFIFNLDIDNMTYENYGDIWHIDHVIPCSKFDLTNEEDIKKCFHWTNIRPLDKIKNMQKSNNIKRSDIFIQEIRLIKFLKENHIEKYAIQKMGSGALTTAVL